jgi:hypothetical protein
MTRQVEMVLGSAQDSGLPVPLHAFARSLRFLQKVTLEIGLMLTGIRPELGPGEAPAPLHGACDLYIRELHTSTPSAVLELLVPAQLQLPEPDGDLGERVLATLFDLTDAVDANDQQRVLALLPQHGYRSLILDNFKSMCPVAGEDLDLTLSRPGTDVRYRLDGATRKTAQALSRDVRPDETVQWRQLIGRVVKIQSFPSAKFAVQRGRRALECPYDPEFEDKLLEMWGSVVRLTAACLVARHSDEEDELLSIQGIEDIETVDESPLVITGFECGGRRVDFVEPLRLLPAFDEDAVVFEDPNLGIIGYGDTREQAEAAARDNLCWLWDAYAGAVESELAPDARQLRTHLLRLAQTEVA